ncbi:MAG: hypothetical protein ACRDT2_17110 [Natronosporangium sp.]
MAILLDFRKVREDQQVVEYIFGDSGNLERRLVVEKESQQARPLDGKADKDYTKIYLKILQFYQREASWPETGSYSA